MARTTPMPSRKKIDEEFGGRLKQVIADYKQTTEF